MTGASFRCAVFVVLCVALTPCSLLTSGDRDPEDLSWLMWTGYHAVVVASASELQNMRRDFGVVPEEMVFVDVDQDTGDGIYRLPGRFREDLRLGEYRIMESPPFRFIDPDIVRRRESDDPAVWASGYKDEVIAEKMLRRLARDFPDYTKLYEIGKSREGRTIYALKISDNPGIDEDEPALLFNGAHHGGEFLAVDYVLDLAQFILSGRGQHAGDGSWLDTFYEKQNGVGVTHWRRARQQEWINRFELWFVPVVNPDGLHIAWNRAYWSGRKNARDTTAPRRKWNRKDGVDLNRNYPFFWKSDLEGASSGKPYSIFYRGPKPGSEPEVRAIMGLAQRQRFVAALSYHCFATKVLVPYTIDGAVSPIPNPAWRLGESLAAAGKSHRPVKRYTAERNLYAVDGTDQDWLFHTFGTMAFIVEGSYLTPDFEPKARLSIQGMRPLSVRMLELYEEGPIIVIHTRDASGGPIPARVEVLETAYYEGEIFTSHPTSGRYDYWLAGVNDGPFTVRASKNGYYPAEARIRCGSGLCPIVLELEPVSH